MECLLVVRAPVNFQQFGSQASFFNAQSSSKLLVSMDHKVDKIFVEKHNTFNNEIVIGSAFGLADSNDEVEVSLLL